MFMTDHPYAEWTASSRTTTRVTQGVDQLELQLDSWSNPSEAARGVHTERALSAMLSRDAVMAKLGLTNTRLRMATRLGPTDEGTDFGSELRCGCGLSRRDTSSYAS